MVFIIDEGGVFPIPMNKLWEYVNSPELHNHPSQINPKFEMDGSRYVVSFDAKMPDGRQTRFKIAMIPHPPVGMFLEYLEGPLTGSKSVTYYIPKGNETGVTVAGEFTSQWMSEEQLKQAVRASMDMAFNEDVANMRKMK